MKISRRDVEVVKRPAAKIQSFPFPTKDISITLIKVNGRHPSDMTKQHIEHKLTLICYVVSGQGRFVIDGNVFNVKSGDAILIEKGKKYFIKGELEYIVSCSPTYFKEQHEQV